MSNVIPFTPRLVDAPRPRFRLDFDRHAGTTTEPEAQLFWEISTELRKARAAGDAEVVDECIEELTAIRMHSQSAVLRAASGALLAA